MVTPSSELSDKTRQTNHITKNHSLFPNYIVAFGPQQTLGAGWD